MEKLNILWVSDNRDTAEFMVFMYAINAKIKGWFDEVEVIIWGASTKLAAEDESIKEKIRQAQKEGVVVKACLSCTEKLGVSDELRSLDVTLDYMGLPLTAILKGDEKLLTI